MMVFFDKENPYKDLKRMVIPRILVRKLESNFFRKKSRFVLVNFSDLISGQL